MSQFYASFAQKCKNVLLSFITLSLHAFFFIFNNVSGLWLLEFINISDTILDEWITSSVSFMDILILTC